MSTSSFSPANIKMRSASTNSRPLKTTASKESTHEGSWLMKTRAYLTLLHQQKQLVQQAIAQSRQGPVPRQVESAEKQPLDQEGGGLEEQNSGLPPGEQSRIKKVVEDVPMQLWWEPSQEPPEGNTMSTTAHKLSTDRPSRKRKRAERSLDWRVAHKPCSSCVRLLAECKISVAHSDSECLSCSLFGTYCSFVQEKVPLVPPGVKDSSTTGGFELGREDPATLNLLGLIHQMMEKVERNMAESALLRAEVATLRAEMLAIQSGQVKILLRLLVLDRGGSQPLPESDGLDPVPLD